MAGPNPVILKLGNRVNIDCKVDSLGLPNGELKWIKVNNNNMSNNTVLKNTNKTELILHFEKLARDDTGTYQCVASNSIGTVKSELVNITVQGTKKLKMGLLLFET